MPGSATRDEGMELLGAAPAELGGLTNVSPFPGKHWEVASLHHITRTPRGARPQEVANLQPSNRQFEGSRSLAPAALNRAQRVRGRQ